MHHFLNEDYFHTITLYIAFQNMLQDLENVFCIRKNVIGFTKCSLNINVLNIKFAILKGKSGNQNLHGHNIYKSKIIGPFQTEYTNMNTFET